MLGDGEPDAVPLELALRDGEALREAEAVTELDAVSLRETDAEAVPLRDSEPVRVGDAASDLD